MNLKRETESVRTFTQKLSLQMGTYASVFWAALAAVALFKLFVAYTTYGTNDVAYFEKYLRTAKQFGGGQVFTQIWHFNHPFFFITWLYFIDFLCSVTTLQFPFFFRFFDVLADVGSVFLVMRLVQLSAIKLSPVNILLLILSPASIMVSGFHGNYDPILIFVILLTVYAAATRQPVWLIGFCFGMSLNLKIVGIMLIPLFLFYLPDNAQRIRFLAVVVLTFIFGSMPYILDADLKLVYRQLFDYNSGYGLWGLARIFNSSPQSMLNILYASKGKYLVLAIITLLSFLMNRKQNKVPLFLQCGLVFSVFIALTPGFGVQYLTWLSPWLVVLETEIILVFSVASGIFLFWVYTFWSQKFPWYYANSDVVGTWLGDIIYSELLCWLAVVLIAVAYIRYVFFRKT